MAACATDDIETEGIVEDGVGTVRKVGLLEVFTVAIVDRVAAGVAGGVGCGASMDAEAIDNLARVRSKG